MVQALKSFMKAVLIFTVFISSPAFSQTPSPYGEKSRELFDLAKEQDALGNDREALKLYKHAAELGASYAAQEVFWLLLSGNFDTTPQIAKAETIDWLKQISPDLTKDMFVISDQNAVSYMDYVLSLSDDDISYMRLTKIYEEGISSYDCDPDYSVRCTSESKKQGLLSVKLAAESGHYVAQTTWGAFLFNKRAMDLLGLEINAEAGIAFLFNAHENGEADAMIQIARVYEHGFGMNKNIPEAIKWYEKYLQASKIYIEEQEAKGVSTSLGSETLALCKLHFLRGDKLLDHQDHECNAYDKKAFYQNY